MLRRTCVVADSWRSHGITYLQSLNIASAALQRCVKEAKASKYSKHAAPGYFAQKPDGTGGFNKVDKVPKTVAEMFK